MLYSVILHTSINICKVPFGKVGVAKCLILKRLAIRL